MLYRVWFWGPVVFRVCNCTRIVLFRVVGVWLTKFGHVQSSSGLKRGIHFFYLFDNVSEKKLISSGYEPNRIRVIHEKRSFVLKRVANRGGGGCEMNCFCLKQGQGVKAVSTHPTHTSIKCPLPSGNIDSKFLVCKRTWLSMPWPSREPLLRLYRAP